MPAKHEIDDSNKLIITRWAGILDDNDMIQVYLEYLKNIKTLPQFIPYNEIVDFSKTDEINLSVEGIKKVGEIASTADREDVKTKCAIVVNSNLAFGLARMYQVYRSFSPRANKELRVFKKGKDALEWVKGSDK
ncbi:MAG TPA: hypothetical protein VIQ03_02190 [Gammaproteobacteria bacterium]